MQIKVRGLVRDLKIEVASVIGYICIYVLKQLIPEFLSHKINLSLYFTQDRLNGIAALFAITIGVYITVITVLAASEIGLSKKMLERRLDKRLINVIIIGMTENFVSIALSVFVPMNRYTKHVLMIFLIVSIISFVKFIVLLVTIFKGNMNHMAKSIDEEDEYKERLLICVEGIYRHFQDCKKEQ